LAFFKRVNVGDVMEQLAKFKVTTSKDIHIGSTVTQDFFLEIEHIIVLLQFAMPFQKRLFLCWTHSVGTQEAQARFARARLCLPYNKGRKETLRPK
jgi:hypothetical protein